jgi:hypothetical protein
MPQLASLGCSSIGIVWSDLGAAQQAPVFGFSNFCKAKAKQRGALGPQMSMFITARTGS